MKMTRFSRLKQTFLFTAFCFMSYLGLICQVPVLLPASQKPSDKDTPPLLDYRQPRSSALHGSDAEDVSHERVRNSETLSETSVLERSSRHDDDDDGFPEAGRASGVNSSADNSTLLGGDAGTSTQTHGDPLGLPQSSPAGARHRTVQFVPVGGSSKHAFGAYLDLRQADQAVVRIFVLQPRKDHARLVCFVCDEAMNYTLYAQPYRMCENHGKEYEGWIYSCVLPRALRNSLPRQVSVAPSHATRGTPLHTTLLQLRTIPPRTDEAAANIGVCVPPLFGHPTLASVINFIQMCKVLGADRVLMYTGSVSSEIRKFLTHHSRKDPSLSVTDWQLPDTVRAGRGKLWYHGQLLAIQDCLYHNMAAFRFLLFMDLDEMLVPQRAPTWPAMLRDILTQQNPKNTTTTTTTTNNTTTNTTVAAFSFQSVFFDPARVPPRESESIVYFQHVQRTRSPSKGRHKVMARPMEVLELGIHHLSRGLSQEGTSLEVGAQVALLHHYRVCQEERGEEEERGEGKEGEKKKREVRCDLVVEDRSMLRYKHRLAPLSHRVLTEASKLFA